MDPAINITVSPGSVFSMSTITVWSFIVMCRSCQWTSCWWVWPCSCSRPLQLSRPACSLWVKLSSAKWMCVFERIIILIEMSLKLYNIITAVKNGIFDNVSIELTSRILAFVLEMYSIYQESANSVTVAQGIEWDVHELEGRQFDPCLPFSMCQSVLGQDSKPNAPVMYDRESATVWIDALCEG